MKPIDLYPIQRLSVDAQRVLAIFYTLYAAGILLAVASYGDKLLPLIFLAVPFTLAGGSLRVLGRSGTMICLGTLLVAMWVSWFRFFFPVLGMDALGMVLNGLCVGGLGYFTCVFILALTRRREN